VRRQEQERAVAALGVAEVRHLVYADRKGEASLALGRDLTRVIREAQPARVFAPTPVWNLSNLPACHQDHLAVGAAVAFAVHPDATTPDAHQELAAEGLLPWQVRELWFMSDAHPNPGVDVTDTFETKLNGVRAHETQVAATPCGPSPPTDAVRRSATPCELAEQPAVMCRLAARAGEDAARVGELFHAAPAGVIFVAWRSSRNAAAFGGDAVARLAGLPAGFVPMSVLSRYGREVDYRGHLVVAVSQSGETPDVVAVTERLRERGLRLLRSPNDPASSLADLADLTLALGAGEERAVPATKTVSGTMLLGVVVAAGLGHRGNRAAQHASAAAIGELARLAPSSHERPPTAGAGNFRLAIRHIVPNSIGTIVVNAASGVADAILGLASLSFLGLGLPPPAANWGGMLSEATTYVYANYWWEIYAPGICLVLTVLAFNFLGEALRDSFQGGGRRK